MKKGFTIVELLAVIIILSLLITITGVSVSKIVKNSRQKLTSAQESEIINAAKAYISNNMGIDIGEDECGYISLSKLKQNGLIESIEKYKDKYIKVTVDNTKLIINYEYEIVDSVGTCVEI